MINIERSVKFTIKRTLFVAGEGTEQSSTGDKVVKKRHILRHTLSSSMIQGRILQFYSHHYVSPKCSEKEYLLFLRRQLGRDVLKVKVFIVIS